MSRQRTLRNTIRFHGIGLHSGVAVAVKLVPAPANAGISFLRTDVFPSVPIPATIHNVVNIRLSTTIGSGGCAVAAIEHLMAAFFATGIDNARVEVHGPELPILDGSSLPFAEGILRVGVEELTALRSELVIKAPVTVAAGTSSVSVYPADDFRITCRVRFRHSYLGCQSRKYVSGNEDLVAEYLPARTFGFLKEVEFLHANGLGCGGSLANALIIGDEGVINDGGMRFSDEPVRHKMLDLMGDLMLAGHRIFGHFRAFRSGHFLNCRLVEKLLANSALTYAGETCVPCQSDTIAQRHAAGRGGDGVGENFNSATRL